MQTQLTLLINKVDVWFLVDADSRIPVVVVAQVFLRNIKAEALWTHAEVIDGDVAVDSHAFACFDLHEVFGRNVWKHNLYAMPLVSDVLRRPPERGCDIFFGLQLHHGDVEASRVHAKLVNEETRHASVLEGRTRVGVAGRRGVEDNRVHDCVASESYEALFLGICRVLIHVHEHVEAGLVGVLIRVVELGPRFLCRRGAHVPIPLHNSFSGVLPAAPIDLEITSTAERNFICKATE